MNKLTLTISTHVAIYSIETFVRCTFSNLQSGYDNLNVWRMWVPIPHFNIWIFINRWSRRVSYSWNQNERLYIYWSIVHFESWGLTSRKLLPWWFSRMVRMAHVSSSLWSMSRPYDYLITLRISPNSTDFIRKLSYRSISPNMKEKHKRQEQIYLLFSYYQVAIRA